MSEPSPRARRSFAVSGRVQGVGFRPFVHGLAVELGLAGAVWNDPSGVVVDVEGAPAVLDDFGARLRSQAPPVARVDGVTWREEPVRGATGFVIDASRSGRGRTAATPDLAVCDDCLTELNDPGDRRFRHPFITCTNCGPRYTITTALPYDRPTTSMAGFAMCADCAREYADPGDRRFHAQTVCCPACGPRLSLVRSLRERTYGEAALLEAQRLLADGAVVAVKGVGGFHLVCDATDEAAVATLRKRKHRGDKPFAVMVREATAARRLAVVGPAEESLLTSPERPVVLARSRHRLAASVAPGNDDLGLMLPSTPLHHLLLDGPPLVMTSGNLAGEPIATSEDDAVSRLQGIADAWLTHDRAIHVPCDDSVVRPTGPVRRSRGHTPDAVALPFDSPAVLAVGADLHNTFALAEGGRAWPSAHVGDMDDLATLAAFERAERHLEALTGVRPVVLVADRHPGYRSRTWAHVHAAGRPVVEVQHHHAHVCSTMVENGVPDGDQVLGFAFDGTGYGTDGTVWGGEVLLADYGGFERAGHLNPVALPGGDAGVHNPCRMALSHLRSAGVAWDERLPCVAAVGDDERTVLDRALHTGFGCVPTTSMGRLFDAVASIAGICHRAGYDAQAAMELETAARAAPDSGAYRFGPGLDARPVVAAVAADILHGRPAAVVAARFQQAVVDLVLTVADDVRERSGPRPVTLSGGVFLNAFLASACAQGLTEHGHHVLVHRVVPPSDAGIALGQVAVAAHAALTTDEDGRRRPSGTEQSCA